MKKSKSSSLYKFLLYITNNELQSRHEIGFDIAFIVINTVVFIGGAIGMYLHGDWPWISIIAIEYVWAFDAMRHNRA